MRCQPAGKSPENAASGPAAYDQVMQFGAGLPITAMSDAIALRDFTQALDGAGFDVLTSAGHLLGVPAERYTDRPQVTYTGPFHDPFVAFGYLSAITQRIHFRPNILILPLYPTAIVAKQSAELQHLSNGRFELGIGISWNTAEYRAVGADFTTRGRRLEEQVDVLRQFWSQPYVTYSGRWHELEGVGLNRVATVPIPVWIGGADDRVLRRAARVADGFMPLGDPFTVIPKVQAYVREVAATRRTSGSRAGRRPAPTVPRPGSRQRASWRTSA